MPSNPYYDHSTFPAPNAPGSSAQLRAELEKIEDGFDLLPTLAGNGGKLVRVNAGATALESTSTIANPTITGGTINNTVIGGSTPAAGTFSTLAATTATVGGAAVLSAASSDVLTNKSISGATNTLSAIGNASLSNSSVTIGSTNVALGATAATLAGLTSVTATSLVGALTGNASTVTNGVYTTGSYSNPTWITSIDGTKITANLATSALSGQVAVANGGTGASTAAGARTSLLPTMTGNGGKAVLVNAGGTDIEYATLAGTGTVTSVAFSGGTTGLTSSGGPVTAAGTITLAGTLAIANGGTGATSAGAAMTALAGAATSGYVLRGNGTNVVMAALQASDIPTLNQNTSGTAANVTGIVSLSNGGTGATNAAGALDAIAGGVTSGYVLRGNGTHVTLAALQAGDIPALSYAATNQGFYVGTTSMTINRGSASQALTGITSIDGSAAKLTTARTIAGTSFDGSANISLANKFVCGGTSDANLTSAQYLGALGTGLVKNTTTSGTLSIADPSTDYQSAITASGVLKGAGSGSVGAASAGTDYVAPGAVTSSGLTMATAKLLGRSTAATGAIEAITVGTGLTLSGGTLSSSAGAMTYVATATASNSALISFTDLASGYDYMIVANAVIPQTAGDILYAQVSTDNGSTWKSGATDYHFGFSGGAVNESDYLPIGYGMTVATTGNGAAFVLRIHDPGGSTKKWIVGNGQFETATAILSSPGPQSGSADVGGYYNATTAVNAIALGFGTQNVASGTFCLYKIARS